MSYCYEHEKVGIFTDDGQRMFLAIRDNVQRLLAQAGAVRCQEAVDKAGSGSSWARLACIDRFGCCGPASGVREERRMRAASVKELHDIATRAKQLEDDVAALKAAKVHGTNHKLSLLTWDTNERLLPSDLLLCAYEAGRTWLIQQKEEAIKKILNPPPEPTE